MLVSAAVGALANVRDFTLKFFYVMVKGLTGLLSALSLEVRYSLVLKY